MGETYERDVAGSSMTVPAGGGCQFRVQRSNGNLHQISAFGPEQGSPDAMLGIKLAQYRPVQGELADIGRRGLAGRIGWGVVGLEVDDQNFVWRHHKAVDLT